MKTSLLAGSALLLLSTTAAARAFIATPGAQRMPEEQGSALLGLSAHFDLELVGKYGWLISQPGFVPVINNSVMIEASTIVATSGNLFLAPLLWWGFHLHPQWTVFGQAGVELGIALGDDDDDDHDDRGRRRGKGVLPAAIAGGVWRFSPDMSLRGEVDLIHDSVRGGVIIPF